MNSPLVTPALRHALPFLKWWPRLDRETLRADFVAGLIGAVVVLPQGVAFATLAGLPPEYGLYCAMVPTLLAALFGSSLHAVSGPTNAVSLVTFATLSTLAAPFSPEYVRLAFTLAFFCGVLMIAMGLLRLGALVNFMSSTVVIAFTAAIGVLIFALQLPGFLGIDVPTNGFVAVLSATLVHLREARPWVIAVAIATVAIGVAARRYAPRMQPMMLAMVGGSVLAFILNQALGVERTGLRTLGALPGALPPLSMPDFSPDTLRTLLGGAFGVTFVALTQAISIERAVALRSGQRLDVNQEFIGQGLGNIAAAFFSGFPTSASVNRCGVNYEAGARTPMSAVFSALLLVAVLALVAPLAAYLPLAVVAGVLILVAWGLIDLERIGAVLRTGRGETAVLAITFLATLFLQLEFAILAGVATSLVLYLNRTSHPVMRTLVPDPRHSERKMTPIEGGLRECPQLKILFIEGSIYFGAVSHVEQHLETLRLHDPEQKYFLVMARNINFIDMAGAELLADEARRRRAMGGRLYLYGLRQPVHALLERGGYMGTIGRENIFGSKREAIATVFQSLDRRICARCHARIFVECRDLPAPEPLRS